MIDIIITIDYEIFGNGTGDVKHCIIEPTNQILDICNRYGVKLTIFFEICEYWAFKKVEEKGKLSHLKYSPSHLMEKQAIRAIKEGHDVQLHLHPQWLGAKYKNKKWYVNFKYWRLPKLPHGLGSFDDILSLRGLLYRGKRDLEKLLKPIDPGYKCIALRAGGLCIQPSENIIRAMKDVGLTIDSSVGKGLVNENCPYYVNFKNAYSHHKPWPVEKDIAKKSPKNNSNILEMPIYTKYLNNIGTLNIAKIVKKFRRNEQKFPSGCTGTFVTNFAKKNNPNPILKKLFQKRIVQWDFCNLTTKEMVIFLDDIIKTTDYKFKSTPIIMIGHAKTFTNKIHFENFLNLITQKYKNIINFKKLRDLHND